jgi:hypothetical protein
MSANSDQCIPMITAPVPWSLAWREDGELATQDRFDLLQSLVACESAEVQSTLITAVERLSNTDLTSLNVGGVTSLCA